MPDRNKVFVLHIFHFQRVFLVGLLSLQRRQCDPAAAGHRFPRAVDHVAADRTDIELGPQHIAAAVLVDDPAAVDQLGQRSAQRRGQRLQQRNIRQALGRFPLRDCFIGHTDHFRQFRLRHTLLLPQRFNGGRRNIGIHPVTSFFLAALL